MRFVIILLCLIYQFAHSQNDIKFLKSNLHPIPEFELKNIDNQIFKTNNIDVKGFVVVFTCNHCPFAQLYSKRLNELYNELKAQNVMLIAINSMDTILYEDEGLAFMQEKAKKEAALYPYLQDAEQKIGKVFGATHTPQAFVLWRENGELVIKYKGAIDDNSNDSKKAQNYISMAVSQLINHKKVSTPQTKSFGCKIYYR